MSGIDEMLRDIPECPSCGRRPDYWTIRGTSRTPILWLFSEKYRKKSHEAYGGKEDKQGEVRLRELQAGNYQLTSACCMGIGCRAELDATEYPELFEVLYKLFDSWFPNKLERTDYS